MPVKVCTIGTGYVGLVTAVCLADIGHQVLALDNDQAKIDILKDGRVPIYEPGLAELIGPNGAAGRLAFSTDVNAGIKESDIVFITVGTPPGADGAADLSAVEAVAKLIAANLDRYKVIVNKSTMPIGSTTLVERVVTENLKVPHEFSVISNPEFLREGSAVEDFMRPHRIVIGTDSDRATGLMQELYRPLNAPVLITDPASAEMIKYASNCFLATKVSYINAIANICDSVGADVKEVVLGMGYDPRIGFEFLRPGAGFGGSCFPKDCQALLSIAREHGYDFNLLRVVLETNQAQKARIVDQVNSLIDGEDERIGILGLAFKPNTDDMRDAPALDIIRDLSNGRRKIVAYDPVATGNARRLLDGVQFVENAYDAAQDSDILLVLTEWDEFKWLDWRQIKSRLRRPIVFDARNCLDPQALRRLGFTYQGVGRR